MERNVDSRDPSNTIPAVKTCVALWRGVNGCNQEIVKRYTNNMATQGIWSSKQRNRQQPPSWYHFCIVHDVCNVV